MRRRLIYMMSGLFLNCFYAQNNKDSTLFSNLFIDFDLRMKSAKDAVITYKDKKLYDGTSGIGLFNAYRKSIFPSDISMDIYYRLKFGFLIGLKTQVQPSTIFGWKWNNFIMVGYSTFFKNKFYGSFRIGFTHYSFTFLQNKNVRDVSVYIDSCRCSKAYTLSYQRVHDLYLDAQLSYFINKKWGIGIVFTLLREYGDSNLFVPRCGIGCGDYSFDYLIYLKSLGIILSYRM